MSPCQLTCIHCNGNYFLKLRNLLTTNIATEYQRLQQAITVVTTDDGFSLPVPLAAKALHYAKILLKWMAEFENKPKATTFAVTLVKLLKECSSGSESKSAQVRREIMWGEYYQLHCSERFCTLWSMFIRESINEKACPIFYQFVADVLFEEVVTNQFPINNSTPNKEVTSYFSYEELKAL